MRTETDIKNSGQAEITDKRLLQQLMKEEIDRNNTFIYSHDTRRGRLGVNMLIRIYTPNRQSYSVLVIITMDIDYQNIIK